MSDPVITLPPFDPFAVGGNAIANRVDLDCTEVRAILRIREGASLTKAGVGVMSTSERVTTLLGAGTPAALRRLSRDWEARAAWNRMDARQRAIVLAAWTGALDDWHLGD